MRNRHATSLEVHAVKRGLTHPLKPAEPGLEGTGTHRKNHRVTILVHPGYPEEPPQ